MEATLINNARPLLMTVCSECEAKFFFSRSAKADQRRIASIRSHHQAIEIGDNQELVECSCSRCRERQFIEISYTV